MALHRDPKAVPQRPVFPGPKLPSLAEQFAEAKPPPPSLAEQFAEAKPRPTLTLPIRRRPLGSAPFTDKELTKGYREV